MLLNIVFVFILLCSIPTSSEGKLLKARTLSSSRLQRVAESTNYDEFVGFLGPILRSRVPGTKGHHFVKEYIIKFFEDQGWTVTRDEFDQDTVIGPKRFTNIVATANPKAEKFVLLTAHYDSKIIKSKSNQDFIAATDSAVPCAMMMSIAKSLDLKEMKKNNNHSLQMVFFDGEEAFKNWTEYDSLYGSRHLAKIWSEPDANGKTHLANVEFLILLDLIGAQGAKFYSSFVATHGYFQRLQKIETRLHNMGHIQPFSHYFIGGILEEPLGIEDDHMPFLQKGVPILHVIPIPFPLCWHQLCDNDQTIDKTTVYELLKVFHAFFKEIMRL